MRGRKEPGQGGRHVCLYALACFYKKGANLPEFRRTILGPSEGFAGLFLKISSYTIYVPEATKNKEEMYYVGKND